MPMGLGIGLSPVFGGVITPTIAGLNPLLFLDAADSTALRTSRTGSGSVADAGVVGMVLDKSQLGGLGVDEFLASAPEILANGTFDSDVSSWAMVLGSGSVTWASGAASVVQVAAYRGVYQVISGVVPGEFYRLTFTLSNVSFASTGLQGNMRTGSDGLNGDATTFFSAGVTTPGTYSFIVRSTITAGSLAFRTPDTSDTYTLDNISLKHLPGYHAVAQSDAARPVRNAAGGYLDHDLVDDNLQITIPTGGWTSHKMAMVTTDGLGIYGFSKAAGTYSLSSFGRYLPGDKLRLVAIVPDTVADSALRAAVTAHLGEDPGDYGSTTSLNNYWHTRTEFTSFPAINTGSVTNAVSAWANCSSLTSFPLLDTSSMASAFQNAWVNCTNLADFPAGFFDGCVVTNFTNAFNGCALTQQSVDNILVSIASNGTSSGTLNITGGTSASPSATGLAAKTELEGRGWTVTVN